ncbi:DUF1573 domain-containing protein [Candidatus Parcubacteria bacterium]|nr:MAG: DUF1573 domain-containing protein [Candidatus Parcubacteria bacterium]
MNKNFAVIGAITIITGIGLSIYQKQNPSNNNSINTSQYEKNNVVKVISAQEFAKLVKTKNTFLLDVHTPEQTHIPDTDAFIPFDKIKENTDKLPQDLSTPILIYCRSGGMSQQASKEIASLGYTNIYELEGGSDVYKESNVNVSLTPNTKNLGTVTYGDIATTTFTFTNYSPMPVKITRISTSCGCTKASVKKEKLEAYESTIINVSFDPAVHKDDTDLGELTRTIYIETDNPNFPSLESSFTATVIKEK